MAFSDKVPAKYVYKISEDVINTDQNLYQYKDVSSIHRNSGFVFYPIYFSSYSLEIIYTLKWCQKWNGNLQGGIYLLQLKLKLIFCLKCSYKKILNHYF